MIRGTDARDVIANLVQHGMWSFGRPAQTGQLTASCMWRTHLRCCAAPSPAPVRYHGSRRLPRTLDLSLINLYRGWKQLGDTQALRTDTRTKTAVVCTSWWPAERRPSRRPGSTQTGTLRMKSYESLVYTCLWSVMRDSYMPTLSHDPKTSMQTRGVRTEHRCCRDGTIFH